MTYEMKGNDVEAASKALINWLDNQSINPHDAVRVLTTCLVAVIHEISIDQGLSAKEGGRIVSNIIMESLP